MKNRELSGKQDADVDVETIEIQPIRLLVKTNIAHRIHFLNAMLYQVEARMALRTADFCCPFLYFYA